MALLARRKWNELSRLDDLVVSVEHADGTRDEFGRAAFELHPVPVAVVVHAEAKRDLGQKTRHGKRRSRSDRTPRNERANGGDDPFTGARVRRGDTAEPSALPW